MVVHHISLPAGEFGGSYVDALFMGRLQPQDHPSFQEIATLRVSAHFFVDRQGHVTQYVPVQKRAWHAGVSTWKGRKNCNDFSVGIELEGDAHTPFEERQYLALADLVRLLQSRYPALDHDRIVGHEHIAPGRKWDPGPTFDWHRLKKLLHQNQLNTNWPLLWEA